MPYYLSEINERCRKDPALFIADCDAFIEKIKTVRDQARTHMEEMLAAAKELESHEN